MQQQQTAFENIEGKEEIACNKQCLPFPQCFLLNQITVSPSVHFLAPLAEVQRAIVMAMCLSCVCPFVHGCVHKLFLQKTSQKLLTGFLPNITGMFLR